MKKHVSIFLIMALLAGILSSGIYVGTAFIKNNQNQKNKTEQNTVSGKELAVFPTKDPMKTSATDVSGAADCVMPALVSINAVKVTTQYDIFGRSYSEEYSGTASGIIAAQNNGELLIMTNYHVVQDAKRLSVDFIDGMSASASIKGTDEAADLAVIAVSLDKLEISTIGNIRIATIGQSDELKLGQMVIAIGNAMGHGQSTTVGYVSAIDREITIDGNTMTLIQTDAAINQGNSGGALINTRGEVVGINNAKLSGLGVEGMGFAIPMSRAIPIIEQLMNLEVLTEEEKGYIGINAQVVSDTMALSFDVPKGLYIKSVMADSPAEKAGLKKGNIIIKINGQSTLSQEKYDKVMSYIRGGSQGTITYMEFTNGKYIEKTVDITFGVKK